MRFIIIIKVIQSLKARLYEIESTILREPEFSSSVRAAQTMSLEKLNLIFIFRDANIAVGFENLIKSL